MGNNFLKGGMQVAVAGTRLEECKSVPADEFPGSDSQQP